jgi:putative flippase GtrA
LFWRFLVVGAIGFFVDVGILLLLTSQALNPYVARIVSFLFAATCTWLMNRVFTFNTPHKTTFREWQHYILIMSVGSIANYVVYALFIYFVGRGEWQYVLGVALGSLPGLCINFIGSRRLYR